MNDIVNPHDSFFRETFGRKEIAASFLREYLPASIREQVDLNSLVMVKDSFVDKELRQHFSDLLYIVRQRQGNLYLYLLFEHKSSPDPWIGLQLLRYLVRIWEQHRKQYPKKRKLPAIVPLVLYHGRRKWKVSYNFRSLIAQNDKHLAQYIPDFQYRLYDLSALSDEEIHGEVLERISLLLLKHIFNPDLAEKLPEIIALLQNIESKQNVLDMLEILLRYVVKATKRFEEKDICKILNKTSIREDIMQTFIDKYIEQGKQQGMQQGGYKILAAMLVQRFGSLPEWAGKKIKEADVDSLEDWSIRLLSADNLDEVFH